MITALAACSGEGLQLPTQMGNGQCDNPRLRWQVMQMPAISGEHLIRVVPVVGVRTEGEYILHPFQIRQPTTCAGRMSGIFTNWPWRQGRKGYLLCAWSSSASG